ncbi:gamma-glutamyltransferase [Stutzerimonas urumqiensis]|uniref:gamma-glutamyltransferase n=1 Tax=Stutzerimonas urumqiensis TaxID=638269 RepID=UPI000EAD3F7A|nr:gamma-glutamyltransferase [Stutzerimonas urumqiensis]
MPECPTRLPEPRAGGTVHRSTPRPLARLRALVFTVAATLLLANAVQAQAPGQAAIATAHPLASEAGAQILADGGNAFDAAVAIGAALAVVEPYGSGMGGGGFFMLRQAGEAATYRFLDARERAPLAATADLYLRDGKADPRLSLDGPLAAGIPGLPAAWVQLADDYGRLPLTASLAPAIRLAREGFPVDAVYRERAGWRLEALQRDAESARLFLLDGAIPPLGHRLRQPELADTLERLAVEGNAGFYAGPVAERLVAGVREAGGIWTREDLAQYETVLREPLVFALPDERRLISAPLPSAGGVAIAQSLGLLERLDWRAAPPLQRVHLVVESLRRAYRDRGLLGDPDFIASPVDHLLSDRHLDQLATSVDPRRATPSATLPPAPRWWEGDHTTHFVVMDADGNAVAATVSLNLMFGAAFTVPGTGVLLNDQMDDFAADLDASNAYGLTGSRANLIAPGKRPLSSMSPTFIEGPQGLASFGTPGGSRIPSMNLLSALAYLGGEPVPAWAATRRYHHQYLPDVIQYEEGAFSASERQALEAMGHRLEPLERAYGNQQIIYWDKRTGAVQAASDPRGAGEALVIPASDLRTAPASR